MGHFLPKNCWRHQKYWVKKNLFDFFWNFLWFPSYGVNFSFIASFLKILDRGVILPLPNHLTYMKKPNQNRVKRWRIRKSSYKIWSASGFSIRSFTNHYVYHWSPSDIANLTISQMIHIYSILAILLRKYKISLNIYSKFLCNWLLANKIPINSKKQK